MRGNLLMKVLETIFLILMIVLPSFFIILGLANIKKVKKNKRFRKTLLRVILLSFVLCGLIWGALKMTNDKRDLKENDDQKYSEENDNKTEKPKDPANEEPSVSEKPKDPASEKPSVSEKPATNKTSKGFTIETRDGVTYIDGHLLVNKTYPLPKEYVPSNTHKAVGNNSICQDCIIEEAYTAYTKMKNDASALGLNIWIASGYRSYSYQNALYTGYVKRSGKEAADTYSARAGHSEHQSGYAFDLNSVTDAFANTKEGKWINENCYKYGFIIRYPKGKDDETGYKYESWHLRYVGIDLATKLYNAGDWITMETYFGITSKYSS